MMSIVVGSVINRKACLHGWRVLRLAALAGAGAIMAGCNSGPVTPPLGAVEGNVTLDGKPADGVIVVFMPDQGRSSSGMTDQDGNYSLDFDSQHKGAVAGKHKVRMTKNPNANLETMDPTAGPPMPIPVRYNDQTILEAQVKEGENTFNFELTTAP